jgi:hypothetical protein
MRVAAVLSTLAMSFSAGALISSEPRPTNGVVAEQQRFMQFYDAELSFQKKIKVGQERYTQKQIDRGKVIEGMSSELRARQATVVNEAGPTPDDGPPLWGWLPSLAMAVLTVGYVRRSYLNSQSAQDTLSQEKVILPEPEPEPEVPPRNLAAETFFCKGLDANGRGLYAKEGFLVLAGSSGRQENAASSGVELWLAMLLDSGVVRMEGDTLIFEKDHLFPTPSMAAMVLMGKKSNGWLEWRTEDGIPLEVVERQQPRE